VMNGSLVGLKELPVSLLISLQGFLDEPFFCFRQRALSFFTYEKDLEMLPPPLR